MRFRRKPQLFIGHLERYLFASLFSDQKNIIDLGSKDGYGSQLMSHYANHITLADNNKNNLAKAEKFHNYLCPVKFVITNLEKEFPNGNWDTIVAFEIIEHLNNYEFFIQNIQKHLAKDGIFVFSVPHMIKNLDHKVLFDEEKIKQLISKYFKIQEFYIQDKIVISDKPATSPPKSYVGVAAKL